MMLGVPGLHYDSTALRPPPCSTCDLRQQLKRPLGGAEVGQVETGIRVHHADQGDIRKIQPLGDHLGAEQDIGVSPAEGLKNAMVRPLGARGVEIHSCQPRRRESLGEKAVHLVSTYPAPLLYGVTTLSAPGRDRLFMAAVVTAQAIGRAMNGESDAAPGTTLAFPTAGTFEEE